jgi:uncharacterized protein YbbK (DUF523 family)
VREDKPLVGVSQCLLGDAVRYDGHSKANQIILNNLSLLFDFIPVCPEVEAGLAVPRPPVELTGSIEDPKLTGRDDSSLDVTRIMQRYCKAKPAELSNLSGFIFKSHSPSCGLDSTPVYIDKRCVTKTSRGIFTKNFCTVYPSLPVIEETGLETKDQQDRFIQAVLKQHTSSS